MSDHKKVRIVFRFKLAVCILLVLLFMVEINCRNIKRLKREVDKTDEDDSKSETRRSSTENQTERNIMYKKYLEDPLLLDYGRYTPQSFHYVNFQDHLSNRTEAYDKCIDQYIRCVASIEAPTPVCVYNFKSAYKADEDRYTAVESYCDAYLENCRVGYRYYRVVAYGECEFTDLWSNIKNFFSFKPYKQQQIKIIDSSSA
ncbi:uncharacterized protein LOC118270777 isoform X2 [Spodoptera frugiperda]|uniref:Uncharacterized protein LOC118270777 isoform X2 n=1 Tax=Spodoptera frugiperda TaxID=7108 RepID=A0A9R0EKX5_SPOFR|nr:uncharacterized protein LOC118270777 isoform X2 [Spodoptera frugiperda]